jgi:hypothetical protein
MKSITTIVAAVLLLGSMAVEAEAWDNYRRCRPEVRCHDVVSYQCRHGRCREVVRTVCREREWCGHRHRHDGWREHWGNYNRYDD